MNILTIGGATTDIFLLHEDMSRLNFSSEQEERSFILLEEGQKIALDGISFHTGGGATNSAMSFKRLGYEVTTFFKVGDDKPAHFILQHLIESGIETKYIKKDPDDMTGHSFITPCQNGDRVVLAYRGANGQIKKDDLPLEALRSCKNLYITSLTGESSHALVPITQIAKEQNALVATNPGTSQLKLGSEDIYKALPNIDIFILNSDEACTFMLSMIQQDIHLHQKILDAQAKQNNHQADLPDAQNRPKLLRSPVSYQSICFDIRLFFKEVLEHGPQIVVVTNGAEGVYVATKEQIIFHPSLPTNIANTLGAGDAFGSTFVAQHIQGLSIEESMLSGILNACSVISQTDAKSGLLESSELASRLKQAPKGLFQYFDINSL